MTSQSSDSVQEEKKSHEHDPAISQAPLQPALSTPDVEGQQAAVTTEETPYSIYSRNEKWLIVCLASIGGLFSPLTANIYFPAIPTVAAAFRVSTELINLTVTVYMVFQGISPMIWGPFSDRWGRRLAFIGCLLLLALSCIGVALTPTNAYWLLMVLRCVQAAGSASTIAIGAGVIADIATVSERGSFFGLFSIAPMIGPAIGPVIGGGLSQGLGWRAIFWFLSISSAACMVFMILIFPETLRAVVGNGSIPPPRLSRAVLPFIGREHIQTSEEVERPPRRPFINPLRLFFYPEVTLLLIFNGVIYAVFYGVTASISTLFQEVYPFLTETDVGLCFLAIGGGLFAGTIVNGRLLDREYKVIREKLLRTGALSTEDASKDESFPIEYARLRLVPLWLGIFAGCCAGYGWALQQRVSLAVPLLMQILLGYTIISVMNTCQTLLVDMLPSQGSSITACNNLARCSLGAAMVSVIDIIIRAVGMGWTYVILAALSLSVVPLLFIVVRYSPRWRAERRAKQATIQKSGSSHHDDSPVVPIT
ncbi:MFS general substrate transporter [Cristinia sonorae]|uniref:MFS general substrate transporter n=1 Tax=Cristinia sonorae TaxID=1940300 RepID=A0A8K0UN92_9AGAR|nr:MFS general substrate transporter [Cristinia sonorae]